MGNIFLLLKIYFAFAIVKFLVERPFLFSTAFDRVQFCRIILIFKYGKHRKRKYMPRLILFGLKIL